MNIMKKIKAIILVLWFIISVIVAVVVPFVTTSNDVMVLVLLNCSMSFVCIISDEDIREMDLW